MGKLPGSVCRCERLQRGAICLNQSGISIHLYPCQFITPQLSSVKDTRGMPDYEFQCSNRVFFVFPAQNKFPRISGKKRFTFSGACFTGKQMWIIGCFNGFGWRRNQFSSKWPHLGTRFKRIRVYNGLKAFCDNKLNFMHGCWNTTFPCLCSRSHTSPEEKTAQLQHTRRNRMFFFLPRTDGCQEYLLPQNDTVLMNLTHRVTELTPQALLLYSDAKSDLWNLRCD